MGHMMTEDTIGKVLDFAYDKAIHGVAGLDSAIELAEAYKRRGGSRYEQCNSLIRWQNTKAGTSGFVTGLGGVITMPVTLPANITSVLFVQIRMIAAIAHLGGYDLKDDKVKTLVFVCLIGSSVTEVLKNTSIVIGKEMTKNAIKKMSFETIKAINKKVGFRLLTKFREKGAINMGKAIPIIGGLIGGAFDATATNLIGNIARNTFVGKC